MYWVALSVETRRLYVWPFARTCAELKVAVTHVSPASDDALPLGTCPSATTDAGTLTLSMTVPSDFSRRSTSAPLPAMRFTRTCAELTERSPPETVKRSRTMFAEPETRP